MQSPPAGKHGSLDRLAHAESGSRGRRRRGYKGHRLLLSGLVALGLLAALVAAGVSAAPGDASADVQVDPAIVDRLEDVPRAPVLIVLRLRPDVRELADGSPEARQSIAAMQAKVMRGLGRSSFRLDYAFENIPALSGTITAAGLVRLRQLDAEVEAVALDPVLKPVLASSVPYIGADRLRRAGTTGEGVRVAVLDTGIDADHLDLRDALQDEQCFLKNRDFCPPEPHVAEDSDGHGTHVSGIVASRGRRSSHGVAPGAEITAVKLIEERANAAGTAMLAALDWMISDGGIDVINMSFGSGAYEGHCDDADAYTKALARAFGTLKQQGVVAVGASGNDGSPTKMVAPGCVKDVISVGAADHATRQIADFTNRNETLDLLAPGVGIESSFLSGRTSTMQGTSMAAPHVAGAVALLKQAHPWAGPDVIEAALKGSGGRPTIRYGTTTISTIKVDSALRELDRLQPSPTPSTEPSATASATATITGSPTASPSGTPTASLETTPTDQPTEPPPSSTPTPTPSGAPTDGPTGTPTDAPSPTGTPSATRSSDTGTRLYLPIAYDGN